MGIRIEKMMVVHESVYMTVIHPNSFLKQKEVFVYMLFKPVPKDPSYSAMDLLSDSDTDGFWTLPLDITKEMQRYICDMMDYFI